jgi:hypothetical protein
VDRAIYTSPSKRTTSGLKVGAGQGKRIVDKIGEDKILVVARVTVVTGG